MKNEQAQESDFEKELRRLRPSSVDPEVMDQWLEFASETHHPGPVVRGERGNRLRLPLLPKPCSSIPAMRGLG